MLYGLLEWALRVVVATCVLLLLSLLLTFVWDAVMTLFHGPRLDFTTVAVIAAIVSVGTWNFSLLRPRTAQSG